MKILWKIIVAMLALLFTLCSACGFMFSLGGTDVWSISIPCFLIFGVFAYGLWRYLTKMDPNGDEENPTRLDLNG